MVRAPAFGTFVFCLALVPLKLMLYMDTLVLLHSFVDTDVYFTFYSLLQVQEVRSSH